MAEEPKKPKKPEQQRPKQDRPKGGGKKAEAAPAPAEKKPGQPEAKIPARLRVRYESEIVPELMRELKIENKMRVPKLEKIVLNMALAEARDNAKILDGAAEELKQFTGQKPVITRARK